MAATEELRIVLRTVAETQGAAQVSNSLGRVRSEASRAKTESLDKLFDGSREGALRFVAGLTGVEVGLSLIGGAGRNLHEILSSSIEAQIETQRTARATAAAYGDAAEQFTRFSEGLSAQTGFTKNAILEASLSARTLSQNYGLTIQQTQKLISVSADLARIRGIGVAEAFERVQSAIRGEAEASEFLGLTLNATFLQQNAQNGALRQTFTTLTDAQRAQVVYGEVLRQTSQFQGLASQSADSLEGSFRQLDLAVNQLQQDLGKIFGGPVGQGAKLLTDIAKGADDLAKRFDALGRVLQTPKGPDFKATLLPLLEIATRLPVVLSSPGGLADPQTVQALTALFDVLGQAQFPGVTVISRQLQDIHDRATVAPTQPLLPRLIDETAKSADLSVTRLTNDMQQLQQASASANATITALGTSASTATQRAALAAANDLREIINVTNALTVAQQSSLREQERAKLTTDPGNRHVDPEALARLALLDQLEAAERDLTRAQSERHDIQSAQNALSAEEARQTLAILPQRQAIARIEQQITDVVDRRVQLQQEAAHIAAEQRALPAQNALEDTNNALQRARLVVADRDQSVEDRAAARRQIRELTRRVQPGQELAAFDASQGIRDVERTQRATDLNNRAAANPLQQQREDMLRSIKAQEDSLAQLHDDGERLTLLARVADAQTGVQLDILKAIKDAAVAQQVKVQLTLQMPDGSTQVIDQLIEANGQASTPPVIQVSGVRR